MVHIYKHDVKGPVTHLPQLSLSPFGVNLYLLTVVLPCQSTLLLLPTKCLSYWDLGVVSAKAPSTDPLCCISLPMQATGHHTGAPLRMPGLEPIPASGKHFCMAEEVQKVKVEGGKVSEIKVPRQTIF